MTLASRLAALERLRPPEDGGIAEMADSILATLAEAGTPAPERGAVLAELRGGLHFRHGSFVFRRCGAELLIREYVGVDLDLV